MFKISYYPDVLSLRDQYHFSFQDVVKKICSSYAEVERIVIFHKNGLQALVEYPFLQSMFLLSLVFHILVSNLFLKTKDFGWLRGSNVKALLVKQA